MSKALLWEVEEAKFPPLGDLTEALGEYWSLGVGAGQSLCCLLRLWSGHGWPHWKLKQHPVT